MKKDYEHIFLCFVGVRRSAKGKRQFLFLELASADAITVPAREADNAYGLWNKLLQRGATPGAIYKMEAKRKDGSVFVTMNSGSYEGRLDNDKLVAEWQARHKGAQSALDADGKTKKALRERLDLVRLEPMRLAYQKARAAERHHILAALITAIQSPRSLA